MRKKEQSNAEKLGPSLRITQGSLKRHHASLSKGSTTTVEIIEEFEGRSSPKNPPIETLAGNLTMQNNISILADSVVMGASIFTSGYIEEGDNIHFSSMMKKSKKKIMTHE